MAITEFAWCSLVETAVAVTVMAFLAGNRTFVSISSSLWLHIM